MNLMIVLGIIFSSFMFFILAGICFQGRTKFRRLWIYKITTQLIIWLSLVREKSVETQVMRRRIDRTFYPSNYDHWACCDCGLVHLTMPLDGEEFRDRAFKFIPLRPDGYDYKMRLGCEKPAQYFNETGGKIEAD